MDEYIRFYNYEHIQTKTGLTLLSLRQASLSFFLLPLAGLFFALSAQSGPVQ